MPPTPQPTMPRPLIIVVCESVPTSVSGYIHAVRAAVSTPLREVFEVDLVDDADAGRHDLEGLEGLHAPLQELVALAVAQELDLEVRGEGVGRADDVDLHRVVHDEVHRHERLDQLRVPAEALHRGAHGGEVHEQRHAGEVLQHDAGDDEGNLRGARRFGFQPARARTSSSVTRWPSQLRSSDSSTMRMETGRRRMGPRPCCSRLGRE